MSEPEVRDCACGRDHETVPMIDVSTCVCFSPWAGMTEPDPDCDHAEYWVEGVCREHRRHVPCRPCIKEDSNG